MSLGLHGAEVPAVPNGEASLEAQQQLQQLHSVQQQQQQQQEDLLQGQQQQRDVTDPVEKPPTHISPKGAPEAPRHIKSEGPCRLLPPVDLLHHHPLQQQQQEQQYRCGQNNAEGPVDGSVKALSERSNSAASADPPVKRDSSSNSSSSSSCAACGGLFFHLPKVVAPPARTEEELLQPPAPSSLRVDLLQQPQALLSHCIVPPASSSSSRSSSGKAPWWSAEAQRELFCSPYDAAGFPRLPWGAPDKSRLAERGAVSMDLGAAVQKHPRAQQQQQQLLLLQQGSQAEKQGDIVSKEERLPVGDAVRVSGNISTTSDPDSSNSNSSNSSSSCCSIACSRCQGLRLRFGPATSEASTAKGPPWSWPHSRGPLVRSAVRRRRQQQQPQQHASDDSSASSGSDVAAEDLLPDAYLQLAGRRRSPQTVGLEADWLMRLQDPPQGLDTLDVFAAAAAAAAAPAAILEPLANPANAAALLAAASSSSSSSSNGPTVSPSEAVLDPMAPYRPLTFLERLIAFTQSRAVTSPPLRLSLPQQQQQRQQRQQRQPLPMLAALISRELVRRGAEAAAAAAAAGPPVAGGAAAGVGPRQRRKGPRPLQGEAHHMDSRLLRKALRCFDRSREGLSRSSSSSSSSRIFADFAAVKARLVGLAYGDIPFDPDGLWLRTQQMQQQRQQQLLPDSERQQQQQQRTDGLGASGTSTLPLMQAAMRRVRLSAKYRHPSVRISSSSSSSRAQGGGFCQRASIDLGCGAVLATHAASSGCYYFEVLVGPVPSQQQQQLLLHQPKSRLSQQQQQLLLQQQVAVSSQCDLRVGWSTRRHPPSAPLGSTRDSVALTLRGTAAWAGIEVPCCCPQLKEGDVIGCCIRLTQADDQQQQQQPGAGAPCAAASAAATTAAASDAYSVSCLMDLDRLAQGFLRSAAGLSESSGGPPAICEAPRGSQVQFTVNGRPLGPCCFKQGSSGCLLVGEYFPAVSLMGGASCFINFGPSFSYPPPAAAPPYSPCCLLPLPLAPPLTFDVYPLLLLPQQLLADPELNILRPRTFADVLEQRILATQQHQRQQQEQQQLCPHSQRPMKRRAIDDLKAAAAGLPVALSTEAPADTRSPQQADGTEQQQQEQRTATDEAYPQSCSLGELPEATSSSPFNSSCCCCSCSGYCCKGLAEGVGALECRCSCSLGREAEGAEAEMVKAAQALLLSPEEIRQLQVGLKRQQHRQQLLLSIHRSAFESQLKSCHAVLAAAAEEWGVSSALSRRRKMPWVRHKSNLYSSSSSSSDSDPSSDESSSRPSPLQQQHEAKEGPLAAGAVRQQPEADSARSDAADPAAAAATATAPAAAAAGAADTSSSRSSSSGGGVRNTPYVDFKHPCSVFFSFLLPTVAGLDSPPPAAAFCASAALTEQAAGGGTAAAAAASPAAAAAWRRFARLFWLVVAPLDSQRRPLSARVFIHNETVAAQRKARAAAAARAAATPPPAAGAVAGAATAAAATAAGTATPAGDASAAGAAAAPPPPPATAAAAASSQPSAPRPGRPGGGPSRRKGSSAPGSQGLPRGVTAATAAAAAADATSFETVRVGQLTLRVPQGALAESEEEEEAAACEAPPDGLVRSKRAAAGGSGVCTAEEADSSEAIVALLEPAPLSVVLVRRLGLKPRQLLEALGCRFRVVSRQLAGSQAGIAGVQCIYTAVVRLRQLQAKAQAAEEEAAKDVACEFWIQQHASALCNS